MKKMTKAELKEMIVELKMEQAMRCLEYGYCPFMSSPVPGHSKEQECDGASSCREHQKMWKRLKRQEIIKEVEAL